MLTKNQIPKTTERTFPPLGDTSEGSSYIDSKWLSSEAIAEKAGDHAFANFASFTGCAVPATADCSQAFLLRHAEGAYRRPLLEREKASVLQVYTEVTAAGGTPEQGVQAGVRAIYDSPQFLYRTEFGAGAATGPLANRTAWQPFELQFTAPADADGITIRLARENCGALTCSVAGTIWFDDFELSPL